MLLILFSVIEEEKDQDFLIDLFYQYYPLMRKKAYEVTNDYNVVDDLIQDVFLKLIPKTPLLRTMEYCKRTSYIIYSIRNMGVDYIRAKERQKLLVSTAQTEDMINRLPDSQLSVEELIFRREDRQEMFSKLSKLTDRDITLLYYKYNMDLKDSEISRKLGIPVNNVRQYLTRARRRALNLLKKEVRGSD
ncbi:sigma-70 family RNA polymerase sigma factor [Paenibacillus sp. MER 180]|uniref:RNA polymerase sigma factor n=1 Tax=Paenibacillus sp. MER 180 TaxID=2939570 RepID=UPI00203C042E|nr:sigma-70 family RNA polymerase sigma factor [Paenibacillus sp. MER 180]MCM3290937.1 sigma-70 family RNA polymerase sigma factor [Paenibacillus sp. MER 180]